MLLKCFHRVTCLIVYTSIEVRTAYKYTLYFNHNLIHRVNSCWQSDSGNLHYYGDVTHVLIGLWWSLQPIIVAVRYQPFWITVSRYHSKQNIWLDVKLICWVSIVDSVDLLYRFQSDTFVAFLPSKDSANDYNRSTSLTVVLLLATYERSIFMIGPDSLLPGLAIPNKLIANAIKVQGAVTPWYFGENPAFSLHELVSWRINYFF